MLPAPGESLSPRRTVRVCRSPADARPASLPRPHSDPETRDAAPLAVSNLVGLAKKRLGGVLAPAVASHDLTLTRLLPILLTQLSPRGVARGPVCGRHTYAALRLRRAGASPPNCARWR
jgi:hypothetical protein